MQNSDFTIIAGPCSIDENNIYDIYQIADIKVKDKTGKEARAVAGTRVVGVKSRTELNPTGTGMGIDYNVDYENYKKLAAGGSIKDLKMPPSVELGIKIFEKTNLLLAFETTSPLMQLSFYEGVIPAGKLMPWNPAVNQLGWPILEMAEIVRRNGWHLGLKNGKWLGEHASFSESSNFSGVTSLEKTWAGLTTYVGKIPGDTILIHRGVDVPDKKDFRSLPLHNTARRVKMATGIKLYFDPSHAYGPKMRDSIPAATLEAAQMTLDDEHYLYDGILIEVGTAITDTEQHITIAELTDLAKEIGKVRNLVSP